MRSPACRLTMTSLALAAFVLPACGRSQRIGVEISPETMAAANRQTAAKDVATCLSSDKVIVGVDYVCADGTKRTGTSVMRTARTTVAVCSRDNEKGCLTTENFSAFAKVERAKLAPGNVKQGVVIAAITGTLTSAGPEDCVADGEIACVSNSAFPAATSSGLGSKVLIGQTVAGIAGNVGLCHEADQALKVLAS